MRLNEAFRKVKGFQRIIEVGDEVICLESDRDLQLCNGQVFRVTVVESEDEQVVMARIVDVDVPSIDLVVAMEKAQFGKEKTLVKEEDTASLFDYGYAMTCHKAQGSQWKHVGVISPQPLVSWQYTAVTRAEEKLTVFA